MAIAGLGVYLPEEVRTNDYWPDEVVERWRTAMEALETRPRAEPKTEGERVMAEILAGIRGDPFGGCRQRHVLDDDRTSLDMEVEAARAALEDAHIDASAVDFVLSFTMVPDVLNVNTAALLHHRLGLKERCLAAEVGAESNAFLVQLSTAAGLIASGSGRFGLLVQSNLIRRLMSPGDPRITWIGDGATAVVVGPARAGNGLVSAVHMADGRFGDAMVTGRSGQRWYGDGPCTWHVQNPASVQGMVHAIADRGKRAMDAALAEAELRPTDVDGFACYQSVGGMLPWIQSHFGFDGARAAETFSWAASLYPANVPLALYGLRAEAALPTGCVVALFSGGAGETWSAALLRWEDPSHV